MENTSGGSFKLKPIASVICISEILISPGTRNAIAINKTRERKRDKLDIETRFTMLLPLLHSFRSKYRLPPPPVPDILPSSHFLKINFPLVAKRFDDFIK